VCQPGHQVGQQQRGRQTEQRPRHHIRRQHALTMQLTRPDSTPNNNFLHLLDDPSTSSGPSIMHNC
jgi:hypothetical protein